MPRVVVVARPSPRRRALRRRLGLAAWLTNFLSPLRSPGFKSFQKKIPLKNGPVLAGPNISKLDPTGPNGTQRDPTGPNGTQQDPRRNRRDPAGPTQVPTGHDIGPGGTRTPSIPISRRRSNLPAHVHLSGPPGTQRDPRDLNF